MVILVLDEKDVESLEHRFDLRYKLLKECINDMDDVRKEFAPVYSDIASVKKSVESLTWIARTTLGAVIASIVGLVFAIVSK